MNSQVIAPGKRATKRSQSRFQRLWAEAESVARENDKLNNELDALVQRIGADVGKAESALGRAVRLAVHRQLDFAEKKSLLKWQRAELSDWIDEHLQELLNLGELDEALQNRLAALRARELNVELDESSELSPVEQMRAYLDKQIADELKESNGKHADEDNGWFDDTEAEEMSISDVDYQDDEEELAELLRRLHEEFDQEGGAQTQSESSDNQESRANLDDAVFKRLFRQTAAALHPDKEIDPVRQREKHELMSELLKARKERDLITILRLHEQYASADSGLSTTDEQQLEQVLVAYLGQQRERMDDIVHRSPMHRWVFQEFYHENPATTNCRVKAHIKKIDTRREGLNVFVTRVKTLQKLKELLADRYERHRFGASWF